MRTLLMITTALFTAAAAPAFAQGAAAPHTMDAQLDNLRANGEYQEGQQHSPSTGAPAEVMESQPIRPDGTPSASSPQVYRSMIDSQGNGAIAPLPLDIQTNGSVTYVSGGISDEEMDMLKARANEFNLRIALNSADGHFMVASNFHVLDSTGLEVLRIDDAGPYVYAKLKPGKYTIEAVENGEIKTATVNVPNSGSTQARLAFQQ
jgi:hypothetical protein